MKAQRSYEIRGLFSALRDFRELTKMLEGSAVVVSQDGPSVNINLCNKDGDVVLHITATHPGCGGDVDIGHTPTGAEIAPLRLRDEEGGE